MKSSHRRRRRVSSRRILDWPNAYLEERVLLTSYLVTSAEDSSSGTGTSGTLRFVLEQLAVTGTETNDIAFAIGSGSSTITLGSDLPPIARQVTIDGLTQPGGAAANTSAFGTNAVILVQLDLNGRGGLRFAPGSAGSVVRGLAIFGGGAAAIEIGDDGVSVEGSFLGVRSDGVSAAANEVGVAVSPGVAGARIGGAALAARNLISGNRGVGVSLAGSAVVAGNLVGTDRSGRSAVGNEVGVRIASDSVIVGGAAAGEGNVISGNRSHGISASGVSGLRVEGNRIGLQADGQGSLANLGDGVLLNEGSSGNSVGSTIPGGGNTIAFNLGAAVRVVTGAGNAILGNSLFANGQGIVLEDGGNADQSPPSLRAVTSVTNLTTIELALDASFVPGTRYTIEVFATAAGDPPGSVSARHFLGRRDVLYLGPGIEIHVLSLDRPEALAAGQQVSATATSPAGNTSELAAAVGLTNPFVVTTVADDGVGSLRQVLDNANANPGTDFIQFNIPGAGPHVIRPSRQLPELTAPVFLDATTQPGYLGTPVIGLDGSGQAADGIVLAAGSDSSRVRGFQIFNFAGAGVRIQSNDNVIQNLFLGTNAAGTAAGPGNLQGLRIENASGNTIGGLAGAGNLISGNDTGIVLEGNGSRNNVILGNRIGTDLQGQLPIPNRGDGIRITRTLLGASNTTIGGTNAGAGNTIALNLGAAIAIVAATGNALEQNAIFGNGAGIVLEGGGNSNQPAPILQTATSTSGATLIGGRLSGFAANSTFTLEFFASAAGDPPGEGQARIFLGSERVATDGAGAASFSVTVPIEVPTGQRITATATSPARDTSPFATPLVVGNTLVVINTQDRGVGSLREAILNANASPGPDTITFAIPGGGPFVIGLASPLPAVEGPVVIDGTSQEGFAGNPLIELDGGGVIGDGLDLAPGSGGSVVRGLVVRNFGGAGIRVQSSGNLIVGSFLGTDRSGTAPGPGNAQGIVVTGSNNTIGGTAAGVANVIAYHVGAAVTVDAGTGNALRQNSIFANGQGIVLSSGGNGSQPAPSLSQASSAGGSTLIDGELVGFAGSTAFVLEFFASAAGDPPGEGQAHLFLGSATVTTDPAGRASFSLAFGAAIPTGRRITATATSPGGNTSALAASIPTANPFQVFTTRDSGVGSLRQVILNANANPGLDTITFALPGAGPHIIAPGSPLPPITDPVVLDGSTQPGFAGRPLIQIAGGGRGGEGLNLAPGSGGSTLRFLILSNFGGAGIRVQSDGNLIAGSFLGTDLAGTGPGPGNAQGIIVTGSNNTIGGTTPGAANVIAFSFGPAVSIDTGTGNAILGNSIFANGQGIVFSGGGNASQPSPQLTAATSFAGVTSINGRLSGFLPNQSFRIEFFASEPTDPSTEGQAHNFLGSREVTTDATGSAELEANLAVSVPLGQFITATATSPAAPALEPPLANNTSPFAPRLAVTGAFTVINLADSGVGSLRQAIENANANPGIDTIRFDLPAELRPFVIKLQTPLPAITDALILDATTQAGFVDRPVVQVSGQGIVADGLVLDVGPASSSQGSTIRGLSLVHFAAAAIRLRTGSHQIQATTLGLGLDGAAAGPGNGFGIVIDNAAANSIGGSGALGNVISGNGVGVVITGPNASGNLLIGNKIGTDLGGLHPIPNRGDGVQILAGARHNAIGGGPGTSPNLISGNGGSGILIQDSSGTNIRNTWIGPDASGQITNRQLDNRGYGIRIRGSSATENVVGEAIPGVLTLVSGNALGGIELAQGATRNRVQNTLIGTDLAGTGVADPEANGGPGVAILNAPNNTVGTPGDGLQNVISGNRRSGILVSGEASRETVIINSFIGTDRAGSNINRNLGNREDGIRLENAPQTWIGLFLDAASGGVEVGAGNIISGNHRDGVRITGDAQKTRLESNLIGTDASGQITNRNLANANYGILLDQVASLIDIGGATTATANTISGNLEGGVRIQGGSGGHRIQNNFIGSNRRWLNSTLAGNASLGNGAASAGAGISIIGSSASVIRDNLIAGNSGAGIELINQSNHHDIGGNAIGISLAINPQSRQLELSILPNGGDGIRIEASHQNQVGILSASGSSVLGNRIAGNVGHGVSFRNGSTGNRLIGNEIGLLAEVFDPSLDPQGLQRSVLGNFQSGVFIEDSSRNLIGGPEGLSLRPERSLDALGPRSNWIGNNGGEGVHILSTTPGARRDNLVQGNLISRNGRNGVLLSASATPNTPLDEILHNFIGTTSDGSRTFDNLGISQGNGLSGVSLQGVPALIEGNVISGNGLSGVNVSRQMDQGKTNPNLAGTSIRSNKLGTDKAGSQTVGLLPSTGAAIPLGNVLDGILLDNVVGVVVGGPIEGTYGLMIDGKFSPHGNLISGNLGRGIELRNELFTAGGLLPAPPANTIQGNLIGTDVTGQNAVVEIPDPANPQLSRQFNLGNLSDGIFILQPSGELPQRDPALPRVLIRDNVVSGNRGFGIHAVVQQRNLGQPGPLPEPLPPASESQLPIQIEANFIGTSADGMAVVQSLVRPAGNGPSAPVPLVPPASLGNGSDGIFLDGVIGAVVRGNVVSGNRSNGIHLLESSSIHVSGNSIGTNRLGGTRDAQGQPAVFGNASNGVFVNRSSFNLIGGSEAEGNLISGNLASGIFISGTPLASGGSSNLSSNQAASHNVVAGNLIGLDRHELEAIPNAVSGIVLSSARNNSIGVWEDRGSLRYAGNIVSGNQLYGIQLSEGSDHNRIGGNHIGTDRSGSQAIPNTSDGVFFINAAHNLLGGLNDAQRNLISGNRGNGVRIFGAGSIANQIVNNHLGLDRAGVRPVPNAANGILLDNAGRNLIGGVVDPADASLSRLWVAGNVISGNLQSGVMILDSQGGGGSILAANRIGTDRSGQSPVGNGSSGIFVYGSSGNRIGGVNGLRADGSIAELQGNLISGNVQAGIMIFSPAPTAPAAFNEVLGNLIGTNIQGDRPLGNGTQGVWVVDGRQNQIGGGHASDRGAFNLISGNRLDGVVLQVVSTAARNPTPGSLIPPGNTVAGNFIGTNLTGLQAIPNLRNGVLLVDAIQNSIGRPQGPTIPGTNLPSLPSNVISGNLEAGIQLVGQSTTNWIQANYIGVAPSGELGVKLGSPVGVFLNNTVGNLVGGTNPGGGNIITASDSPAGSGSGIGIEILGPADPNVPAAHQIQGNLIGLSLTRDPATGLLVERTGGNQIGVLVNNSAGNLIGGIGPEARNVVSGNRDSGIRLFGQLSTANLIAGNFIGTNIAGSGRPGSPDVPVPNPVIPPSQASGVSIQGAPANVVGSPIAPNLISGNTIGVVIEGRSGAGEGGQIFGGNLVQGNRIGTDATGRFAVPNFEFGILINNSVNNLIGGPSPDPGLPGSFVPATPGNLISGNGIAGVAVFGGSSQVAAGGSQQPAAAQGNLIAGNWIGPDITGSATFSSRDSLPPTYLTRTGVAAFFGFQQHGVVVIGSSFNAIGAVNPNLGNWIRGNIFTGVYISRRDFAGTVYSVPVSNAVQSNTIDTNGIYGVLRYDAPNNTVFQRPSANFNTIGGNPIPVADYVTGFNNRSPLPPPQSILLPPVTPNLPPGSSPTQGGPNQRTPLRRSRPRPALPPRIQRRLPALNTAAGLTPNRLAATSPPRPNA